MNGIIMKLKVLIIFLSLVLLFMGCSDNSNIEIKDSNKENELSKLALKQENNNLPETTPIFETITVPKAKPKVIEIKPSESEKSKYNNAYNLWENSNTTEAIKEFGAFIAAFPESSLADDAQKMIGTSYTNLKQYDKAILEYKKVIERYPSSSSAAMSLYNIAHTYFFSLNDFQNARSYYLKFIEEATEADEKWVKVAVDQLNNWSQETKRFEGYAREKEKNNQAYSKSSMHEKDASDDDKGYAWAAAIKEVKGRLKAPSTAKFPFSYYGQYIKEVDINTFVIKSYVDAENSFGAKIRSNFMVKIKRTGENTYNVLDVQIYE